MAELERPVAEEHAPVPGAGTNVFVLILIVLFTLLAVASLNVPLLVGVQKELILSLAVANFALSALYYQGLQHESALNKIVFLVGLACAFVVVIGLLTVLPLGR